MMGMICNTIDVKSVDFKWPKCDVDTFAVDWGDGVRETYNNLNQVKHKYKTKQSYRIEFFFESNDVNISFEGNEFIKSISGVIPHVRTLEHFFDGCTNLESVDENCFIINGDKTDLSYMCKGVRKITSVSFLLHLNNATNITGILQGADLAKIDLLAKWCAPIEIADYAFADRIYAESPMENIFSNWTNLKSANYIFFNNQMMNNVYMYFRNNTKLENIDGAFYSCISIRNINSNWLAHLPSSVKTDRRKIFDSKYMNKTINI